MSVKLPTEHHLGFLSLKGGCRSSSESTLVKMSNCWKSHVGALYKCRNVILLLLTMFEICDQKLDFSMQQKYFQFRASML